jgi:hypothetical protein
MSIPSDKTARESARKAAAEIRKYNPDISVEWFVEDGCAQLCLRQKTRGRPVFVEVGDFGTVFEYAGMPEWALTALRRAKWHDYTLSLVQPRHRLSGKG